jgi:hypothetical protein
MWDFLCFLCEFSELFLPVFEDLECAIVRDLRELRDPRPAKDSGPFGHFRRTFF